MTKKYSSIAIANEFIDRAIRDHINDLTPLKLQKLVYFAHGWYLAFTDEPLLDEHIQAWKYGPVIENIYHKFKNFSNGNVNEKAAEFIFVAEHFENVLPQADDEVVQELIDSVWKGYSNFTPVQLSKITHQEGTPWQKVVENFDGSIPKCTSIPDELIRLFFQAKLKERANG
ncbi:MAG: DUF4065 domain-containing protein [Candidatus Theseobacter exili]|nr:DUF4065 domain-containing protein [Candidatus Theseobacter exili]